MGIEIVSPITIPSNATLYHWFNQSTDGPKTVPVELVNSTRLESTTT
jgi:hypothetical protein